MGRNAMRWALGILWLVDGVLQLQPGMFTMAMVQAVMQPATSGSPTWVIAPLELTMRVFNSHLVLANSAVAGVQLTIGAALLLGGRIHAWPYWLSLAWSALLWPFGQAFGGLLSGGASIWTGAPGSAVLYALLTWAAWPLRGGVPMGEGRTPRSRQLALVLGALWALGAVLQTSTPYFTASGLSGLVTGMVPGEPVWLAALLSWGGRVLAQRPVLYNALSVALCATCAVGIWSGRKGRAALALSMALSGLFWVFGQALGMLFSGMATDPNAAPLFLLLALYLWPPRRAAGSRLEG